MIEQSILLHIQQSIYYTSSCGQSICNLNLILYPINPWFHHWNHSVNTETDAMISVCALKQTVDINASGDPAELPCGALQLPPYLQQICWSEELSTMAVAQCPGVQCPARVTVSISVTLRRVTSWHTLLSSTSHSLHPAPRDCEHKTWNLWLYSAGPGNFKHKT